MSLLGTGCQTCWSEKTGQEELGCISRRRRLTWLGHVARMSDDRRATQVINWMLGERGEAGGPRKNWPETIC